MGLRCGLGASSDTCALRARIELQHDVCRATDSNYLCVTSACMHARTQREDNNNSSISNNTTRNLPLQRVSMRFISRHIGKDLDSIQLFHKAWARSFLRTQNKIKGKQLIFCCRYLMRTGAAWMAWILRKPKSVCTADPIAGTSVPFAMARAQASLVRCFRLRRS